MTLILKLDLDMVKMYYHTKTQVSMSTHSKVIAQTDKQTHTYIHTYIHTDRQTHTRTHIHTHTRRKHYVYRIRREVTTFSPTEM